MSIQPIRGGLSVELVALLRDPPPELRKALVDLVETELDERLKESIIHIGAVEPPRKADEPPPNEQPAGPIECLWCYRDGHWAAVPIADVLTHLAVLHWPQIETQLDLNQ